MAVDETLVAITEDLSPELLFQGYTSGCFPWSGKPARWYCPDPRAIFEFDKIHFSRRLLRTVRQKRFRITFDQAFDRVIAACAQAHESSWIDPEIQEKFVEFHHCGFAHSVEVWLEDRLVGGLYGIHIRRMFCGESMFSFERDASKVAFYHLVEKLKELDVLLFDAQVLNAHTQSLGAIQIPRDDFLDRLQQAVETKAPWRANWAS